jgi:hypothetical protein
MITVNFIYLLHNQLFLLALLTPLSAESYLRLGHSIVYNLAPALRTEQIIMKRCGFCFCNMSLFPHT